MAEVWVVNASPLITLAKAKLLDLLRGSENESVLPKAVAAEILHGPPDDPARIAVESGAFGETVDVTPLPEVLEWGLGQGESAVLTLTKQLSARAVLDDRAARVACRAMGIRFTGTLGIVLRAYRDGRIASIDEPLDALRGAGLYLNEVVIRSALAEIERSRRKR